MRAILHHPDSGFLIPPPKNKPAKVAPDRPLHPFPGVLTIACDVAFLMLAVGMGLLLKALVLAVWPSITPITEGQLVGWMSLWSIATIAIWFLIEDGLRLIFRRGYVPFYYSNRVVRELYSQRLEIGFGAIAAHLLLLCLCLLMPLQALPLKLFLCSTVAIAAWAVRKSIPSRRWSFSAYIGVFSFAMFIVTIIGTLTN